MTLMYVCMYLYLCMYLFALFPHTRFRIRAHSIVRLLKNRAAKARHELPTNGIQVKCDASKQVLTFRCCRSATLLLHRSILLCNALLFEQITTIKATPELRIYDFGGGESLYATHTFFLRTRCVFVIVIDLFAPDVDDINYWLQQVSATPLPCKLIMAYTHVDQFADVVGAEHAWHLLNRLVVRRFAHRVHGHCLLSTVTRDGIEQLSEMIFECASVLASSQARLECELKFEKLLVRCFVCWLVVSQLFDAKPCELSNIHMHACIHTHSHTNIHFHRTMQNNDTFK